MGVRPPSNGTDDDAEGIEFGIAAVEPHLRETSFSFPASSEDVVTELGAQQVSYDVHGNTVTLEEILEEVDQDRFENRQDLLNALHPVFEAYRTRHSSGVIQQVRSFLPF